MKSLIFIALILIASAADPEECLKERCPDEYAACEKEVFGCATKALKCKNQCGGSDAECMLDCALASGNAKLIAMAQCGAEKCQDVKVSFCDVEKCAVTFKEECTKNLGLQSIQCSQTFFERYPDCICVTEF